MPTESAPVPVPELAAAVALLGPRRREVARQLGGKALALADCARAGLPVPPTWVLPASHFEAFVGASVPRGHDLRGLVKASERSREERTARAFARLRQAPLPTELVAGLGEAWRAIASTNPGGARCVVRPSVACDGELLDVAAPELAAVTGIDSEAALVEAVRTVWARVALAPCVAELAAVGAKEPSLALLVQVERPAACVAYVDRFPVPAPAGAAPSTARRTPAPEPSGDYRIALAAPSAEGVRDFGYAVRVRVERGAVVADEAAHSFRAALLALDLPGSEALAVRAELLVRELCAFASSAERELGRAVRLGLHLDASPSADPSAAPVVSLVSLHERSRRRPLRAATSTWVELRLAVAGPEPPTALSHSLGITLVERAVRQALRGFRSEPPSEARVCASTAGRVYLDTALLADAARGVPLVGGRAVALALGGPAPATTEPDTHGPSLGRAPLVALGGLYQQLRLEGRVTELEREIEREFRGLQDLNLTILPDDALATTLGGAEAALGRCATLWAECGALGLAHLGAVDVLVRRKLPDAPGDLAYTLGAGAGHLLGVALALAVGRAADEVRRDAAARERLAQGPATSLHELPDGPGRGAVGQLVSTFGDVALGAGELAVPRWREDPAQAIAMVRLVLAAGVANADPVHRARALADAALARCEPALGPVARRLLWSLVGSQRRLAHLRVTLDRAVYRALALARRVVLDVDRRLRRLDPAFPEGGAFHCGLSELVAALKSGRPELAQVAQMNAAARSLRTRSVPPLGFTGAPSRLTTSLPGAPLAGLGVSHGVAEGTAVRVPEGGLPERLEPGQILVVTSVDPALAPIFLAAGGVLAEGGGALDPGVEVLRELVVPAVVGVPGALARVRDGERLRLDGQRGTVERLAPRDGALGAPA